MVVAHELFAKEDDNVDDPMSLALIPTVLLLKRCLKRLSERVDEFLRQPDVEEVDHEEKLAPQGCRGSSGAEEILEDNRCAPQGVPELLGAEEEVPAFLVPLDAEKESHEDELAAQGCRRSSGAMERLEDSKGGLLGCRGLLNAEEFEPLVVGEVESSISASLEFQEVPLGNGPPDAEEEVPACLGLNDKRFPLGCRGLLDAEEVPEDMCAPRE